MAEHNDLGKQGETAAAEFLTQKGHQILALNFRFGRAEVDIVSQDGNIVVFTEVKTRSTERFGFPEEFVGREKMKLMKDAAEEFLYRNQLDTEVRFDIVSVIVRNGRFSIHHIEDAFFYNERD
ncbi:MAG: YraN family protein [Chitinophagales bacterium]